MDLRSKCLQLRGRGVERRCGQNRTCTAVEQNARALLGILVCWNLNRQEPVTIISFLGKGEKLSEFLC